MHIDKQEYRSKQRQWQSYIKDQSKNNSDNLATCPFAIQSVIFFRKITFFVHATCSFLLILRVMLNPKSVAEQRDAFVD